MRKLFLFLFIFNYSVFAQESPTIDSNDTGFLDAFYSAPDTADTAQNTESPAMILFRIVFVTLVLAFLSWVVIRYFFSRNTLALSTEGRSIEILATVPAGMGSYFLVAKLHNLYYLFSLSNDGLRLLDKISDKEAIDFIELNKAQTLPQDVKFTDLLSHLPEPQKAADFLKDKLDKLKKK